MELIYILYRIVNQDNKIYLIFINEMNIPAILNNYCEKFHWIKLHKKMINHPELKNEFQQLDYKYNSQMKLSFNRDVCIFSIVDRVNQIS